MSNTCACKCSLTALRKTFAPFLREGREIPFATFVTEVFRRLVCREDAGPRAPRSRAGCKRLLESIARLFDLVDIDGRAAIDWESFTRFCVEVGSSSGGSGQPAEGDAAAADSSAAASTAAEDVGLRASVTQYHEKADFLDRTSHCLEIRSMKFVAELGLLLVVEGAQACLKVYSKGMRKVHELHPAAAVRKEAQAEAARRALRALQHRRGNAAAAVAAIAPASDGHTGGSSSSGSSSGSGNSRARGSPLTPTVDTNDHVLAAEYLGAKRRAQICVSCCDGTLSIWELEGGKLVKHFAASAAQAGMKLCEAMDVLVTWGCDEFDHRYC
jgi:hypothetical protein